MVRDNKIKFIQFPSDNDDSEKIYFNGSEIIYGALTYEFKQFDNWRKKFKTELLYSIDTIKGRLLLDIRDKVWNIIIEFEQKKDWYHYHCEGNTAPSMSMATCKVTRDLLRLPKVVRYHTLWIAPASD